MIGIFSDKDRREHWDTIKEFIGRALKYNSDEIFIEDILDGIEKGRFSLWGGLFENKIHSVIVLDIATYPRKKVLDLFIVGSNDMAIFRDEFMVRMVEFAKTNKCTSICVRGRPGWKKVLSEYGFNKTYEVLEKVI